MITTTFGERLLQALKHKGMSQRELAKRIGVSPQNINFLIKEGQGSNKTSQIASILGVNPKWLETGKGDMLLGAVHDPVQARFMQIIRSAQAAIDDSGKELTEDQVVIMYKKAIDFAAEPGFSGELVQKYIEELLKKNNVS
jgi:transcriptional regulator with XRE-family HTH domain